ncbi:MAG TPA: arsenate reductase (glutaredoxin) [Dokdonella sp.]
MAGATIYHNPKCGTSRNVLQFIRDAGIEPQIIEYLKTPPSRERLVELSKQAGLTAREVMRTKELLYTELELDDPALSEDALFDAMIEHPILINRPLVITSKGVKLCRPSETVRELLP